MPYLTSCNFCGKKFKSGTTLTKHLVLRHAHLTQKDILFSDERGSIFEAPQPKPIRKEMQGNYMEWLSVICERVNGSLFPDYPGKWSCIDCFQVPNEYFSHILHRLGSPSLNSVREVKHRRQPMFTKLTLRVSYKIFTEELFSLLLEEQDTVSFKAEALFSNDQQVQDITDMDVETALILAKERAKKGSSERTARPTSSSSITINRGEGRSTREVEFIWWPTLYSEASKHGKLSIRYYTKKVSL